MQSSMRFRIYTSRRQEENMLEYFEFCRWLYNYLGIVKCCVKVPNRNLLQEINSALCGYKPELE